MLTTTANLCQTTFETPLGTMRAIGAKRGVVGAQPYESLEELVRQAA